MSDKDSVLRQIGDLEKRLEAQIARAKSAQTVSVIIGAVLVAVMIGYFTWMSGMVKEALKPKEAAQMASQQIVTRVKELRPDLEKAARENAPLLVDNLVDELINNQIPAGRKALEKEIKTQSSAQVAKLIERIYAEFDNILETHAEQVREMAKLLQTSEGREEFETQMYARIKEAVTDEEITRNLDSYGNALDEIDATLGRIIVPGAELTPAERNTLELLAVVRELAGRSKFDLKTLPAIEGLDESLKAKAEDVK